MSSPMALLGRGGTNLSGSWVLSKGVFTTYLCFNSFKLGFSLNLVIVRIGLVYGPYMDFGLSRCIIILMISVAHLA